MYLSPFLGSVFLSRGMLQKHKGRTIRHFKKTLVTEKKRNLTFDPHTHTHTMEKHKDTAKA